MEGNPITLAPPTQSRKRKKNPEAWRNVAAKRMTLLNIIVIIIIILFIMFIAYINISSRPNQKLFLLTINQ